MLRSEMPLPMAATPADTPATMLFHLGMLYCVGREVGRDYVAAQKWFTLAALMGSVEARRHRCRISLEMTAGQIAEAQRQACIWLSLN
jgi:TPR repeat protein